MPLVPFVIAVPVALYICTSALAIILVGVKVSLRPLKKRTPPHNYNVEVFYMKGHELG